MIHLLGHQRQIRYLERVLVKGTLAHAYLFYGPEAVGKRTVAIALAQSLLCERSPHGLGGCGSPSQVLPGKTWEGKCEACRSVDGLSHPDLIFLGPDRMLVEDESKREIGIKNIRELERLLSLSAWHGGWKVAVIDSAEAMSREAQSALLKTMEEPSGRTLIILVAAAPELLLPTIRSRCVPLGFTTVANAGLEPLLEGVPAGRRPSLLELADGRPGELQRLLSERGLADTISADRERFRSLLGAGLGRQLAFSDAEAREPGRMETFLEFLIRERRAGLELALYQTEREKGTPETEAVGRRAAELKVALDLLGLLAAIPLNRRLAADYLFVELSATAVAEP